MHRFVIAFAVLATGCDLYFDDDDDVCMPLHGIDIAPNQFRDPATGECQSIGGGGCDDRCGPCPDIATDIAQPDWGSCYSQCDGLAENACMATPGCFAAFYDWPTRDRVPEFRGCWQTAPSGPVGGACTGLDAQQCSRHDNCIAYYEGPETTRTPPIRETFLSCAAEPVGPSCATTTCTPGNHCEEQCYQPEGGGDPICTPMCVPDTNACAGIDCGPGWACSQVCSGGTCGAQCVPDGTCEAISTENACKTRPDCTSVYLGEDCTCYPNGGCQCEVLTYDRCETK